jgi:sterol 14alpha-demethylase
MGLLATVAGPLAERLQGTSFIWLLLTATLAFLSITLVINVATQILFKDSTKPPVVFHWFPFIGSTISYGIDPIAFFDSCRKKVNTP